MAPHSSTFAWKIAWMEEPGRLQSMGSLESDTTEQFHFHFSLSCIGEGNGNPLQCSCLENPRDGKPGGLPSLGSHRVGHDWSDLAAEKREIHLNPAPKSTFITGRIHDMPLVWLSWPREFKFNWDSLWSSIRANLKSLCGQLIRHFVNKLVLMWLYLVEIMVILQKDNV